MDHFVSLCFKTLCAFLVGFLLVLPSVNGQQDILLSTEDLKVSTLLKVRERLPLAAEEKQEVEKAERIGYRNLRNRGYDEVSNSVQARLLRNYRLRKMKTTGLFRKRETSLSQMLFPGSLPRRYSGAATVEVTGNLIQSRKNLAMYDISDHPAFANMKYAPFRPTTMGAKLEGYGAAFKKMPFNVVVERNITMCIPMTLEQISPETIGFLRQLVSGQYRLHFQLDDLPVLMRSRELNFAVKGVPIGFMAPPERFEQIDTPRSHQDRYFLYNHFKFTITYHEDPKKNDGIHITGFDIHPVSFMYDDEKSIRNCHEQSPENDPNSYLAIDDIHNHKTITFSYDVQWIHSSDLTWEDRWDVYFVGMPDIDIHYYSIINSVMCVLFLAAAIARALYRTFRRDIAGGSKKESGWKQVHADVFRLPPSPMALSVLVGNGVHLLVTAILTMVLNVFGWINTVETGDVVHAFVLVFAFSGLGGGYTSATVYKLCGGKNCRRNALLTSTLLPGFIVIVFYLFNQLSSMIGSSSDWFSTVELVLVWGCVSVPLVLLGARKGDSVPCAEFPTKASNVIRPIPKSKWTKFLWFSPTISGMMTFSVCSVELHFVMGAIWNRQTYIGLGYLLTMTFLATIVCSECCICFCYLQLNTEDHRWWWTSFRRGAATGACLVLYSLNYLSDRLELVGWYSNVSFLTCMLLASLCTGVVFGSIGFLSCLCFTRGMYDTMASEGDEEPRKMIDFLGNTVAPFRYWNFNVGNDPNQGSESV